MPALVWYVRFTNVIPLRSWYLPTCELVVEIKQSDVAIKYAVLYPFTYRADLTQQVPVCYGREPPSLKHLMFNRGRLSSRCCPLATEQHTSGWRSACEIQRVHGTIKSSVNKTRRNKAFRDDRPSVWHTCDVIITDVWRRGVLWWHILSYLPMVKNPVNKFSSPDTDHLRGGLSHSYNTSCVNKSRRSEQ